ncbi:hypothetical protein SFC66_13555 [Terribacillus saccharophilus]|uniref:hypothetical protein n=1 Tax=Terribacillus saccharophilus TaxID=361277 RepID=UPI0039828D2B
MIFRAVVLGSLAGLILSGWMFLWQQMTGIGIYTLLMNVDFIPIVNQVEWNGVMLNLFHLVISWAIVWIYLLFIHKSSWNKWMLGLALSSGAACVYFPLSLLAVQDVPGIDDWLAICIWYAGHILYGISVVKLTDLFYNSKF